MALLKCPECGHKVSEHAFFCPQCGCRIEYIMDFYKNQEEEKANNAEEEVVKPRILDTLTDEELVPLEMLKETLFENGIPFYYDVRRDYVGLRAEKRGVLRLYYNRHVNGDLFVHIYDPKVGEKYAKPLDPHAVWELVDEGYYAFTGKRLEKKEPAQEEEPPEDGDPITPSLEELSSIYHYTIYEGRVLPIQVIDVTKDKGACRVWYQLPKGDRKFCLYANIGERLFESLEAANACKEKEKGVYGKPDAFGEVKAMEKDKDEGVYVIYDGVQYLIGFHTVEHRDSVMPGFGKLRRSSVTATVQVPDYGDLDHAMRYYTKESAEAVATALKEQAGHSVEIVALKDALAKE